MQEKPVLRHQEQEYINKLLKRFKDQPPTPELKKKIWEELMMEKHLGRITIPFKVFLRKDPPMIEVILDTKV